VAVTIARLLTCHIIWKKAPEIMRLCCHKREC
jgi:hypothetical protein